MKGIAVLSIILVGLATTEGKLYRGSCPTACDRVKCPTEGCRAKCTPRPFMRSYVTCPCEDCSVPTTTAQPFLAQSVQTAGATKDSGVLKQGTLVLTTERSPSRWKPNELQQQLEREMEEEMKLEMESLGLSF